MSTTPTAPDPLGLMNDLSPDAPNWKPNAKVARLSKNSLEATTYPITQAPPEGSPGETGALHIALNDSTDSVVALENASTMAVAGSILQIDSEYMTVVDASDPNNLKVRRATCGSLIAAHNAGAAVSIWES